jgi:arylsulfatase A-like enzyme
MVKPGNVCEVPVSSVDFFPTILDMAGGKTDGKVTVDGISLVPLLKRAGETKRERLYWHYPHYSPEGGKPGCGSPGRLLTDRVLRRRQAGALQPDGRHRREE